MQIQCRFVVVVHNIRSLHNVGSIFRTADGAGIGKIYLTGYTPSPVDEMGRYRSEITKTALGAERVVVWERYASPTRLVKKLKKEGYRIIAIEDVPDAKTIYETRVRKPSVLIVGNEVRGISTRLLAMCDEVIKIPMRGAKESLNVSVAFGVAAYSLLRN